MKKTVIALSILLSTATYAQNQHRHDEENPDFDVDSYIITLQGTQPFGETCYLGVKEEGLTRDGLYYAEVETSFAHEGVGAGVLHVTQDKDNPQILTATKEDGSRISIELSTLGLKVSDALKYAVRWKHETHFDSGLCSDLKVIHDADAEADAAEEAQEGHNQDEGAGFDVNAYILTLQGTEAFGEACYLGVKEEGVSRDGLYYAEVETSFSHEGVGAGVLHVTQDANNPKLLSATKEDGSRIAIELSEVGLKVSDSLQYAVRWHHEDHFDSGFCSDLKVVHDAAASRASR